MIRKSALTILVAICCVTAIAAPVAAATVGGEVFGAFSTHSMKDWNERVVAPANQSGGNMDEFNSGYGGGLGLRMWPTNRWMVSASWEPLFVSREEKVSGDVAKLNANAFEATAGYFFPSSSPARFGLGAGFGIYSLAGEITSSSSNDIKLEGSTVGFHVHGLMEWNVRPGFALTGNAGYRIAKIKDTKVDNQSATPELATDYSGLALRAGVAFYLPHAGQ
jgi:outer membrane protein with beta-barrel domain